MRHFSALYVQDRSNDDYRYCGERQTQQSNGPYAAALHGLRLHGNGIRLGRWRDRPGRLKSGFYRAGESLLDIIVRRQVGLSRGRALETVYAAQAGIFLDCLANAGSPVIQAEPQSHHLRLCTIERRARWRVTVVALGRHLSLIPLAEGTGQLYETVL
jgi:hypothetical protein